MLVECKECGIKFQTSQCGMVKCPNCGREQYVINYDKKPDKSVKNENVVSADVKCVYHSLYCDDTVANQWIKILFALSIVLVVLAGLRFIVSWSTFDDFSAIKEAIVEFDKLITSSDTSSSDLVIFRSIKNTLKRFLSLAYAEAFMHSIMCACSIVILVFSIKAKVSKFPVESTKSFVFDYYAKTMIFSIVMLVISVIYAIIEICFIKASKSVSEVLESEIISTSTIVGACIGFIAFIVISAICIFASQRLSKSQKEICKQ